MSKGLFRALVGMVETKSSAKKVLKASFIISCLPFILMGLVHLFFPEYFYEATGSESMVVASYVYSVFILVMGYFLYKEKLWSPYIIIVTVIGPTLLVSVLEKSFPDISIIDVWVVFFMAASVRSIKFLKSIDSK